MARFTNGTVSYLRVVNLGNYEKKEFKAEISWAADEGDLTAEEWAEKAADHAVGLVHQRLGLTARPQAPDAAVQPLPQPAAPPAPVETPPQAAEAAKRHRATKAEMAERERVRGQQDAHIARVKAEGDAAKARLAAAEELVADTPLDDAGLSSASGTPAGSDVLDLTPEMVVVEEELTAEMVVVEEELTALPAYLTNDEVYEAMVATVKRLSNAIRPRQVLSKYATQVSMIPMDRRAAFVAELKAMT